MHDYAGGVVYVVFWCLLVQAAVPARSAAGVCGAVTLATAALELLQLWKAPTLIAARSTGPGAILLGTDFDWLDFPHYLAGGLAAWLLCQSIGRRNGG
jgi:hypothetical protein